MKLTARSSQKARDLLEKYDLPFTDELDLSKSDQRFDGGGAYGVEVPAINSFDQLKDTVAAFEAEGVYCTRFDETHGSFLLCDSEIKDMLQLCREKSLGILFGIGPRPEYDVKASFYRTPFGLEMGRQLNNHDAFAQGVEEAFRLCALGCTGITVYDIGLMKVLDKFRDDGLLPKELVLKTSSHCMATNAVIGQIFADCGADSITTAHDLTLPVLQEIRRVSPRLVLDVPTDVYRTKGGYVRWYELSEMVQVCSPMMLKMGASVQEHPYSEVGSEAARARARRIATGQEYLLRSLPEEFDRIGPTDRFCCIPSDAQ